MAFVGVNWISAWIEISVYVQRNIHVAMKRNRSQHIWNNRVVLFSYCNYATSFSNNDFSSFKNSTKEARLLKNDVLR